MVLGKSPTLMEIAMKVTGLMVVRKAKVRQHSLPMESPIQENLKKVYSMVRVSTIPI